MFDLSKSGSKIALPAQITSGMEDGNQGQVKKGNIIN